MAVKSEKEQLELLNKVLTPKVTKEQFALFKRRIQLHNMYPDSDVKDWDTKDAEELFEIEYQLEIIRQFENI